MTKEDVQETIYEAFLRDIASDYFKCYGGEGNIFYLRHVETGQRFKVEITDED
jgi:hypothetical protein